MRAVVADQFGAIENLQIKEVAEPPIKPGEVRIDVRATAVNYVDLVVIAGKYQFSPGLPFTPGKGPAGVVTEVGREVGALRVGDRVLAMVEQGGYGAQVAAHESQCYILPEAMTFTEAASMSLVFDTSWFALRDRARIAPGDVVLVLGASGGVGYASMMLAKAMGAKVLAAVSDPAKADFVKALNPDAIIDLSRGSLRESLREQVFAATAGHGADIVIDPLGGDYFDAAIRAVAWRGRLVTIGFAAGRIPTVKVNYLLVKNIEVSGLQVSDYRKLRPDQVKACFTEVFEFYRAGLVRPAPAIERPLEQFLDALEDIRERRVKGRVVLTQP